MRKFQINPTPVVVAMIFAAVISFRPALAEGESQMVTLKACPDSPNCVCSLDEREDFFIGALRYEGDDAEALNRLKAAMADMSRTKLEKENGGYLHYVVTSALFRFKDDVEFSLNPDEKRIEVRSASRVGHSDLGVNRKRVEAIRIAFEG